MRCHACSHENSPGVRTCRACGEPLSESVAAGLGTGFDVSAASVGGVTMAGNDFGVTAEHPGPSSEPPASVSFEHYEILRKEDGSLWELGRGAMGITYKARDTDLHIPVALKVINPSTLESGDALDRFMREARAAAKLRHANIASVFRLGKAGDTHFYAMEFCEGQTVHQLVERRGPLELRLALEITRQVTEALIVAQDGGVVHRDIKPSNLMVTGRVPDEFTVKVIDFGLAKHTAADAAPADITLSSNRRGFVGTAHFASPEQLEDRSVDFRSDLYSLGVTLWFMLTGRPLFEGSLTRVVTQHIMQPAPLEKLAWLPEPVAQLLDSLLAKAPEQRPGSCRELRRRLQRCLDELDSGSTMPAAPGVRTAPATPPEPSAAASAAAPAVSAHPSVLAAQPAIPRSETIPTVVPQTAAPPSIPTSLSPASEPSRPQPTSKPVLLIAAALVLILLLAGTGVLLTPMLKKVIAPSKLAGPSATPTPDATPAPPTIEPRDIKDAIREVRLAQEAAEKMATTLHQSEANRELLENAEKDHVEEGIETYRRASDALDRNRLDAEQAFLIAAKQINALPQEARDKAYDENEKTVLGGGTGWRTQLARLLPKYVPEVTPDATQADPSFTDALKQLQSRH
jgi:serine/threonine protein kinase